MPARTFATPQGLDDTLEDHAEAVMPEFGDYRRMVRRNDRAIHAVLVGGRVAVSKGVPVAELGRVKFGSFLGAGERSPLVAARSVGYRLVG
jgi:hypothetical protein